MAERIPAPADERSWFARSPGLWLLWTGLLAGPAAWALDLGISYALVKWICGSQHFAILHLITVASLLMTAGGAAASWIALRHAPDRAIDDGPNPYDRGRFMAVLGVLISAAFALAIVANTVPRVMLDACL